LHTYVQVPPPTVCSQCTFFFGSPEESATFFSLITFWWINPFMALGYKQALATGDLWAVNTRDQAQNVSGSFQQAWARRVAAGKPSLLFALAGAFGWPLLVGAVFKMAQDSLAFVSPILLEALIKCGWCAWCLWARASMQVHRDCVVWLLLLLLLAWLV
jgi:hypothetical protein